MATIAEDDMFTQVVRFDTPQAETQSRLITAIVAEIERWVCKRPGFVSSTFHASHDGKNVINYAQWKDEASFKHFTEDPETKQLQEAIKAVDPALRPHAIHCHVVRSIGPSA